MGMPLFLQRDQAENLGGQGSPANAGLAQRYLRVSTSTSGP